MNSRSVRDATYAFVDVETTGVDPKRDRVVEVACRVMRREQLLGSFDSLVNPEQPIPAVASAIHHITNADTADAPRLDALVPTLRRLCDDAVIVAHNARFDLAFLPFLADRPVVCAMRLAMHVIDDAPNYKNQVLRYHLGLTPAATGGAFAHRALADVLVTSAIFAVCLQRYLARGGPDDLDSFIAAIEAPRRLMTLPFGRYRRVPLPDVPYDYLRWLLSTVDVNADTRFSVSRELDRRHASVA